MLFLRCTKREHKGHAMVMDTTAASGERLLDVAASVNRFVISNQSTVKPIFSEGQSAIPANGYISEDIRRNLKVSTRISGRIERLFILFNYQYVKKGERIMDIYSPDLNTYLEEYLFLQKKGDSSLLKTAKQKLLLLGVRESQLIRLQNQDSVGLTISVLSPSEGYIIFENTPTLIQGSTAQASDKMGGMATESKAASPYASGGRIREGSYVNEGETLFHVNDFKEVWAILSFRVNDQSSIKKDLTLTLHSELLPMDTLRGNIDFIEPRYETGQTFLQARVYLKNPHLDLKPNSILSAEVFPSSVQRLILPQSSIVHLGKQSVAWVKTGQTAQGNSIFEARLVSLGVELNGFVEITSGIDTKDEVARDAGYLMDSQSLVILK